MGVNMISAKEALRSAKDNLPRLKGEVLFLAAFALFYLEDFNIFSNPHAFAFVFGAETSANINTVSMLTTLAGFIILALMYQKKLFTISEGNGLLVCCGLIVAGGAAWALSPLTPNPMPLQVAGLAFAAFGHLCFLPEIVKNLAAIGSTKSLITYSLVLLIMAVARPIIDLMPAQCLYVYLFISPVIMTLCLRKIPPEATARVKLQKEAEARVPKALIATMIALGLLMGLRIVSSGNGADISPLANSLLLAASAIACATLAILFKLNFNRLFYLTAFPLMCMGLLMFIVPGDFPHLLGNALFVLGQSFFYGVLWALYSYLVRYSSFNYYWLPISAAIGSFLGRVLGIEGFRRIVELFGDHSAEVAFVLAVTVLLAMILCTGLCTRNNMRDGWGSIAPGDHDFTLDPFDRNCDIAAANAGLTGREADILKMLARGRNAKFISENLFISKETTKTHIKRIYRKMGVHSQQEVIDSIAKMSEHNKD